MESQDAHKKKNIKQPNYYRLVTAQGIDKMIVCLSDNIYKVIMLSQEAFLEFKMITLLNFTET